MATLTQDVAVDLDTITKFDDLLRIAQDHRHFSSEHSVYSETLHGPAGEECTRMLVAAGYPHVKALINAGEPLHARHRALVSGAFSASRVKKFEPHIREVVDLLIDRLMDRARAGESFDFMAEFAVLLPTYVICDLIGVSRDHAVDIKRWSDAKVKIHDTGITAEQQLGWCHDILEMYAFIEAEYLKAKADPHENLLGDLVAAEVDGQPLSMATMMSILSGIFIAGNETTTSTLGSCLMILLNNPDVEARLRSDPALIPAFADETIRLESPLQTQFRRNVEEIDLRGVTIPQDSILGMRFGAGNRDAERFTDPDRFDLDRSRVKQHLGFGTGVHACLGMLLARAELRIAWKEWLKRFSAFRLIEKPTYLPSYIAYGPREIVIEADPA